MILANASRAAAGLRAREWQMILEIASAFGWQPARPQVPARARRVALAVGASVDEATEAANELAAQSYFSPGTIEVADCLAIRAALERAHQNIRIWVDAVGKPHRRPRTPCYRNDMRLIADPMGQWDKLPVAVETYFAPRIVGMPPALTTYWLARMLLTAPPLYVLDPRDAMGDAPPPGYTWLRAKVRILSGFVISEDDTALPGEVREFDARFAAAEIAAGRAEPITEERPRAA